MLLVYFFKVVVLCASGPFVCQLCVPAPPVIACHRLYVLSVCLALKFVLVKNFILFMHLCYFRMFEFSRGAIVVNVFTTSWLWIADPVPRSRFTRAIYGYGGLLSYAMCLNKQVLDLFKVKTAHLVPVGV